MTAAFPRTYRGDVRVGGGHFHQVDEVWLILPGGVVVIDVQQRDVHLRESKQASGSIGSWGRVACPPGYTAAPGAQRMFRRTTFPTFTAKAPWRLCSWLGSRVFITLQLKQPQGHKVCFQAATSLGGGGESLTVVGERVAGKEGKKTE